jgi:hypothetical protein
MEHHTQSNGPLIARQWHFYPTSHANRANLVTHLLTVPLFMAGTLALPLAMVLSPWLAPAGLVAMIVALAAQGRGHRGELNRPAPFRGPRDMLARIFVEQWITFPRFVVTGALLRAWRERGAPLRP